jgi:altronate dehydratase small subunit
MNVISIGRRYGEYGHGLDFRPVCDLLEGAIESMKKVFVVEKEDNVGTAVGKPIQAGDTVGTDGRVSDITVTARADIPYGHKIALVDIPKGAQVTKYALSIGSALQDIKAGDHVHIHNVESNRGRGDKASEEQPS